LRDYLERLVARRPGVHLSGITVTYDSTHASGARLQSATLDDGAPIDPAKHYRVILNDFLATGGEGLGLSTSAIKTEVLPIVDLDAMIAYLRSLPQPVRAPTGVRVINRASMP
jgi:2',3'-cyclic-nucleotide 2'-phosphodiesterase (5'-nucleotidase family)